MRDLAQGLFHLAFPGVCSACGRALPPAAGPFCAACRTALVGDPHLACPRCAATVGPHTESDAGCPNCRRISYHFDRAVRLGPYDGLLRDLILRMKRASGEFLGEFLGDLWVDQARSTLRILGAQVVIPVPLHWWRRWVRGYNQSEALARSLAARLDLPCRPAWLRRIRATPQQTRQSSSGRRLNVHGAFQAPPRARLRGQTVLLIDDVLTTGSTCSEAARALRAAGAVRVVVAVLAHSQPH